MPTFMRGEATGGAQAGGPRPLRPAGAVPSAEIPTPCRPPPRWKSFSPRSRNHGTRMLGGRASPPLRLRARRGRTGLGGRRATRGRRGRCRSRSSGRECPRAARGHRRRATAGRGEAQAGASGQGRRRHRPPRHAAKRSQGDDRVCCRTWRSLTGSVGCSPRAHGRRRRGRGASARRICGRAVRGAAERLRGRRAHRAGVPGIRVGRGDG
jgi:hypothetical protein